MNRKPDEKKISEMKHVVKVGDRENTVGRFTICLIKVPEEEKTENECSGGKYLKNSWLTISCSDDRNQPINSGVTMNPKQNKEKEIRT